MFANLRDAGRQLAEPLSALGIDRPLLLPILPNGVPVALGLSEILAAEVRGEVAGRTVVVIDDGVESGSAARAAVGPLRQAGAQRVVLAVPVGPDPVLRELAALYDDVVVVVRAEPDQTLASHYADFDTIDLDTAERLLSQPRR